MESMNNQIADIIDMVLTKRNSREEVSPFAQLELGFKSFYEEPQIKESKGSDLTEG